MARMSTPDPWHSICAAWDSLWGNPSPYIPLRHTQACNLRSRPPVARCDEPWCLCNWWLLMVSGAYILSAKSVITLTKELIQIVHVQVTNCIIEASFKNCLISSLDSVFEAVLTATLRTWPLRRSTPIHTMPKKPYPSTWSFRWVSSSRHKMKSPRNVSRGANPPVEQHRQLRFNSCLLGISHASLCRII